MFYVIAEALFKAQGKGYDAGPYRQVYDLRKAYDRPNVETDMHAHNRAMRYMTKRLLQDLYAYAKRVSEGPKSAANDSPI